MAKKYEGSLWIKNGGGVLILKDGRKIKKGERFNANKEDIPKPFLKSLTLLEGEAKLTAKAKKEDKEPANTAPFKIVEVSKGFYNVVNADGENQAEKSLRKGPADELLASLLEEAEDEGEE